ncbi:MAG TPA: sulfatase-like hydrolase/transferase [Pirellulales bacterium]|jgi:arylsulfatase A-like enzyme|nr:sulfatase-like hydrolase/transferase [Pirellulales bacterium]
MPRRYRALFIALSVVGLSPLHSTVVVAAAASAKPNILLIVSDNQPHDEVGCFGNKRIETPHLDRLAAEGVRLTNFCVASSVCTPSRGAILTGRYPWRNGLYDMIRNDDAADYGRRLTETEYAVSPEMTLGLDVRETLISQPLHEVGYRCGVIGKWDSGRARRFLPLQRGFDFFYGFANTGIDYYTHERYGIPSLFRGNERIVEEGYATDLFCGEAINFIRSGGEQPFFLYLPFNACHGSAGFDHAGPQAPLEFMDRYSDLDKKTQARYACISAMDAAIGKILDYLSEAGKADNTLVIFFSDNGKLRRYQENGIRVPFIARFPGRISAGTKHDEFLTSLEIAPTLWNAAGATSPAAVVIDGFDMMGTLDGTKPSARPEMFWHDRDNRAARVGNLKWIDSQYGSGLFDLAADPNEKHDLSSERPELLAPLQERFAVWQRDMDASESRGPFRDY